VDVRDRRLRQQLRELEARRDAPPTTWRH